MPFPAKISENKNLAKITSYTSDEVAYIFVIKQKFENKLNECWK